MDKDFESLREPLQSLEQYAVLIRYPSLTVPVEMDDEKFEPAVRIRDFVRKKLNIQ